MTQDFKSLQTDPFCSFFFPLRKGLHVYSDLFKVDDADCNETCTDSSTNTTKSCWRFDFRNMRRWFTEKITARELGFTSIGDNISSRRPSATLCPKVFVLHGWGIIQCRGRLCKMCAHLPLPPAAHVPCTVLCLALHLWPLATAPWAVLSQKSGMLINMSVRMSLIQIWKCELSPLIYFNDERAGLKLVQAAIPCLKTLLCWLKKLNSKRKIAQTCRFNVSEIHFSYSSIVFLLVYHFL